MMKKPILVTAAFVMALSLLSLGSCDVLFNGNNLFSSLDGPDVDALKSATGTDLIDALEDEKGGETDSFGDTFVEAVESDPEAVDTIYDSLEEIFSDTTYDASTRAEAAALAADLILATSDTAGPVIDNVVSAVLALTEDVDDFSADELVVEMVESIAPDRDSFLALVADLEDMATAYDALGDALADEGSIELDPGDGQAALIAFTLTAIVDAVQGTEDTIEAKAAALYDQLIGPALDDDDYDVSEAIDTLFGSAGSLDTAYNNVLEPTDIGRDALYGATSIDALIDLLEGD